METFAFMWSVVKGSSISWVAKLQGDRNSECKLSNGWSQSYKETNLLFAAGNEWSQSCRGKNQHPNLPWYFMTHGFLDLSTFPDHGLFHSSWTSRKIAPKIHATCLSTGHNNGDRKGTKKKLCDKDFAERSDEFSGAICLKILVLLSKLLVAR